MASVAALLWRSPRQRNGRRDWVGDRVSARGGRGGPREVHGMSRGGPQKGGLPGLLGGIGRSPEGGIRTARLSGRPFPLDSRRVRF